MLSSRRSIAILDYTDAVYLLETPALSLYSNDHSSFRPDYLNKQNVQSVNDLLIFLGRERDKGPSVSSMLRRAAPINLESEVGTCDLMEQHLTAAASSLSRELEAKTVSVLMEKPAEALVRCILSCGDCRGRLSNEARMETLNADFAAGRREEIVLSCGCKVNKMDMISAVRESRANEGLGATVAACPRCLSSLADRDILVLMQGDADMFFSGYSVCPYQTRSFCRTNAA